MSADDAFTSGEDFLQKLDSGELDDNLANEIKRLSVEQLEVVASKLIEREGTDKEPGVPPRLSRLD